jgi:hypothetical protein
MLSYHPSLDLHHTILRILQIFIYDKEKCYKIDEIRILDFYITFPELISEIRVTKKVSA